MDSGSTSNTSWMDNVFYGWIDTTWDALLVLEAARRGIVPRVTRRFHDIEKRNMIRSGAVIVFTEEESGIKRFTDPYVWSASRMLGNFMIYREREDAQNAKVLPATYRSTLQKPKQHIEGVEPDLERAIYGSWKRGKGLKKDGLMKKTFSLVVDGATYHLISYYNPADVISGTLRTPSSIPHIASLPIGSEFTADESQFRQPPRAEGLSRATSESNNSDAATGHAGPSSERYLLSPVPPVAPSPALSSTSSQWTPTYTSQSEDSRYAYQSPDTRPHENLYGQVPSYPAYASNIHRYDQSAGRTHASDHQRRDDYDVAPLVWQHTSPQYPHRSSSRAYEHFSDRETSQS